MTVASTTSRVSYSGNGSTVTFTVPFYFLANTHLKVVLLDAAGNETVKTLTTDYTVSGAATPSGGSITMVTAPATGQTLSILRNVPYTQETDYQSNDPFPAETHERALDKLTMETQQLAEQANRALTLPASMTGGNTTLPVPEANNLIGWNESLTGLQNIDPATLATVVAFGTAKADVFSGNGSTTQFTLTASPGALNNLDVSISGVTQKPGIDYTWLSGTTITFTTAPPTGTNNVLCRYLQALPQGTSDSASAAFIQSGTGAVTRTAQDKMREVVSVKDFGAVGDGKHDDTAAIQAAIDAAGSILKNGQPPSIYMGIYPPPVVFIPPGAYRLTDTLRLYAGMVLMGTNDLAYTVESTRLIMDTATSVAIATGNELGGVVNLNKPIIKLQRTYTPTGTILNTNNCSTIANIGFWIVNPNGTINSRGGTGFSGMGVEGTGSAIYCEENVIDTRIKRCNFYSMPNAGIWFKGPSSGFSAGFNVDECEFDTPMCDIRVENVFLDMKLNSNLFFSGKYQLYVKDCTGDITAVGNEFQYEAHIEVTGTSNLNNFNFTGNKHDGPGANGIGLNIATANTITIVGNTFNLGVNGTINVVEARGGAITGNTIINAGYNSTPVSPATDGAGIRMIGCQGVAVSNNSIVTPASATYNTFGIISLDGTVVARNTFSNNHISSLYSGASYRSQSRRLNVSTTDTVVGNNFGVAPEYRAIDSPSGGLHHYKTILQASSGNVDIPLSGFAAGKAFVYVSQASAVASAVFEISFLYHANSGAFAIMDVSRNGVAGSGLGPHTILSGNTIAFSISVTNLRLVFAYTTDPMYYAVQVAGLKWL